MLKYLPPYERQSKVFQEIMKAEEIEFEKIHTEIKDLEKQFFVDTATWGLAIYEKELKLPIRPNKSLEERRSIIKAKMRGMGKVDAEMIKAIVEAFTKSSVEVTFDGIIKIIFSNQDTIILNMNDMFEAIEEIKPAHLDYETILVFELKENDIYICSTLISGEEITVYPYSPRELFSKGKVYVAVGSNTGLESITVYSRKEVV
ncbi:putative phage tail protein [Tissierella sp. P1]|uniref:putative phage tail protein n=1 Tax=Tissierella sp. P1 TaxID=1280483 RepID=UPI001F30F123|nr:putative phage tail protein [Tissierella sp. P1]